MVRFLFLLIVLGAWDLCPSLHAGEFDLAEQFKQRKMHLWVTLRDPDGKSLSSVRDQTRFKISKQPGRYIVHYSLEAEDTPIGGRKRRVIEVDRDTIDPGAEELDLPNIRWKVPRTSKGFAPGLFDGIEFNINLRGELIDTEYVFSLVDFVREGKGRGRSRSPVALGKDGKFHYQHWGKTHRGPFERFDFTRPKGVDDQRFVVDFGSGGVELPSGQRSSPIIPIYVIGYLDGWAYFTTLDYKKKVEELKAGGFLRLPFFTAHPEMLRIADERVYRRAKASYDEDKRALDQIIVANRADMFHGFGGGEIQTVAGDNLAETVRNLKESIRQHESRAKSLSGEYTVCGIQAGMGDLYLPGVRQIIRP